MDFKHVPIFVINLNGHTDRLERISRRLNALGLSFERIPAIDGRTLSSNEKQKICLDRSWLPLSDCEIAHYMSHQKALRIVADRRLPRALILEDDATFDDDFAAWASSECPLPSELDLLKLEGVGAPNTIKIPISTVADRAIQFSYKPAGGAAAYMITLDGARKALKALDIARSQLDHDLFAYWRTGLRTYEVFPFPARQEGSPSTILHHQSSEWPLRVRVERSFLKNFDRASKFYRSVKWFGLGALLTARA
jgi:glycosyl transferase family 25